MRSTRSGLPLMPTADQFHLLQTIHRAKRAAERPLADNTLIDIDQKAPRSMRYLLLCRSLIKLSSSELEKIKNFQRYCTFYSTDIDEQKSARRHEGPFIMFENFIACITHSRLKYTQILILRGNFNKFRNIRYASICIFSII